MFTHHQRVERHEVEQWVRDAFPYPHFKAHLAEREEPELQRVRVTITLTGPKGERLIANERSAVYYALKDMRAAFPQMDEDWTT